MSADRLEAILGVKGDLAELNAEFARRIAAGEIDSASPGITEHLWATTLAKLAVDQPNYWGYRAALAGSVHSRRNLKDADHGFRPRPRTRRLPRRAR